MHIFEEYLTWIKLKFKITNEKRKSQIKEGEVYWCSLGLNVGDEQNGKGSDFSRPVLVLKKFNNNIFTGVPMTTKNKDNKYYVKALLKNRSQSAMISQLRTIDTKRLEDKIGYLSLVDFNKIKKSVPEMLK